MVCVQVRQANAKILRLIVVEGYMDVVALFQYGVTAVATLAVRRPRRIMPNFIPQCR